jgi:hypothetical protein
MHCNWRILRELGGEMFSVSGQTYKRRGTMSRIFFEIFSSAPGEKAQCQEISSAFFTTVLFDGVQTPRGPPCAPLGASEIDGLEKVLLRLLSDFLATQTGAR